MAIGGGRECVRRLWLLRSSDDHHFRMMLTLGASVNWFPFLAKAIWTNAKFGGIKDIPGLAEYDYGLHVRE